MSMMNGARRPTSHGARNRTLGAAGCAPLSCQSRDWLGTFWAHSVSTEVNSGESQSMSFRSSMPHRLGDQHPETGSIPGSSTKNRWSHAIKTVGNRNQPTNQQFRRRVTGVLLLQGLGDSGDPHVTNTRPTGRWGCLRTSVCRRGFNDLGRRFIPEMCGSASITGGDSATLSGVLGNPQHRTRHQPRECE
jgi:hypothetical protein